MIDCIKREHAIFTMRFMNICFLFCQNNAQSGWRVDKTIGECVVKKKKTSLANYTGKYIKIFCIYQFCYIMQFSKSIIKEFPISLLSEKKTPNGKMIFCLYMSFPPCMSLGYFIKLVYDLFFPKWNTVPRIKIESLLQNFCSRN